MLQARGAGLSGHTHLPECRGQAQSWNPSWSRSCFLPSAQLSPPAQCPDWHRSLPAEKCEKMEYNFSNQLRWIVRLPSFQCTHTHLRSAPHLRLRSAPHLHHVPKHKCVITVPQDQLLTCITGIIKGTRFKVASFPASSIHKSVFQRIIILYTD